nr:hypothetical protein [Staphylococcus haemolyticus]
MIIYQSLLYLINNDLIRGHLFKDALFLIYKWLLRQPPRSNESKGEDNINTMSQHRMLLLKKGGTHMSNKKKIKVTLAMVNVLLTAVELYLQWQLSKSENEL